MPYIPNFTSVSISLRYPLRVGRFRFVLLTLRRDTPGAADAADTGEPPLMFTTAGPQWSRHRRFVLPPPPLREFLIPETLRAGVALVR